MLEQVFSFGCEGVNGYGLILQQLYNRNICWKFMDKSLPFHDITYHDVGFVMKRAVQFPQSFKCPPSPPIQIPKFYDLYPPYDTEITSIAHPFVELTSVWSSGGVAPLDAFFKRTTWSFLQSEENSVRNSSPPTRYGTVHTCLGAQYSLREVLIYSPLLHMVHLHHGHIPNRQTFCEHKVWRWIRRLRLVAAHSVLLPRVLHREDIVNLILNKCFSEWFRFYTQHLHSTRPPPEW